MKFRIAKETDFKQLAKLRWDFRMESGEEGAAMSRDAFVEKCTAFFRSRLDSGYHVYWVAENEGEIVAQVFVHIVEMIPRPCKIVDRFGYLTNDYTVVGQRNKGIGSKLLGKVIEWANAEDLELLIVYPSERAIPFYARSGFKQDNEVMELRLRHYYSEDWVK